MSFDWLAGLRQHFKNSARTRTRKGAQRQNVLTVASVVETLEQRSMLSPVIQLADSAYGTLTNVPKFVPGIVFTDPSGGTGNNTVSLYVTHGTLSLSTIVAGGLTSSQITGNGTSSVSILAPLTAINSTLADTNGLKYTPTLNYTGSDTLSIAIDTTGNNGPGGPTTASASIALTTRSSNTAPALAGTGTGWTRDYKTGDYYRQYTVARHIPTDSSSITVPSAIASSSDSNGDPVTLVVTSNVSHGVLTMNADSTFTYTSTAGYQGVDSFSFAYKDSFGALSNTARIYLTSSVVNNAPVLSGLGTGWTTDYKTGDLARQYTLSRQNPTASSSLTVSSAIASGSDLDSDSHTLIVTSNVSHGTLNVNADSTFTYTSNAGYVGVDSFKIAYRDSYGKLSNVVTNGSSHSKIITAGPQTN